jgi:hypothetical protein
MAKRSKRDKTATAERSDPMEFPATVEERPDDAEPGESLGGLEISDDAEELPIEPEPPAESSTISAYEAITQAAAQVNDNDAEPQQLALMDTSKPFNFEGCWMEIENKQGEIDELARIHEDDARKARDSKKKLDEAHTLLGKMIDTYRARRIQKQKEAELRAEREASGAICAFERDEKKPCLICRQDSPALAVAALDEMGIVFTDRWSEAHRRAGQDVELTDLEALMDLSSIELVAQALELGDWYVTIQEVEEWSIDERQQALRWVDRGTPADDRPTVAGLPHVAGVANAKEQTCRACGETLHVFTHDEHDSPSYPTGSLIGTSCPGATEIASDSGVAQQASQ